MKPGLRRLEPRSTRAVVLVLHGGQEESKERSHGLRPPYLRMVPFALDLFRHGHRDGVAVWLLRYRYRGWNKPDLDPVADGRWAIAEIRRQHPDAPIVLLGHSMGARVAFRVAEDPAVVAVCALAPWTTAKDHVDHLAGKSILIAHGSLDTTTHPQDSHAYAARIAQVNGDVRVLDIVGENHAMLRKWPQWTLLVRRFVLGAVGRSRVP